MPVASGWFGDTEPVAESAEHCWEVKKALAKVEAERMGRKGSTREIPNLGFGG